MKCAYCEYNDGLVYTSIPPKYKCTITNEFHLGFDDCDVEFAPVRRGRWIETLFGWRCSVCEEEQDYSVYFKYCPNCGTKMDGDTE